MHERIIVLSRLKGRGKASGVELGEVYAKVAIVFRVRDGTVMRIVGYFDRDRACAEFALAPGGS